MWALLNVLKDYDKENAGPANPLAMSEREKLPAEPRLQSAPGFGVDTEKGRVVLELREPQAEYRELQKEWANLWTKGKKDQKTGVVTALPIEEAKAKLLTLNVKARTGADADSGYANAQTFISDAGSGRMASEKRR
jgi:hypothetical protein